MTRLHPFDLAFGELASTRFAEIGVDPGPELRDRRTFFQRAPVERLLADLAPGVETPLRAALMEEYGTLLYATYHYWAAGQLTLDVSVEDLDRAAVRGVTGRLPGVPRGACYLRLPERRMWAQIAPDAPHEPLDGLFAVSGPEDVEVTLLAVLGLWADRDGFSQIAVTAPREDFRRAAEARREPLFAPLMEGGERAGLRSITTEGELLDLARLALKSATG